MKLKNNEVLIIKTKFADGSFSEEKYIFGSEAKGLRKNSVNLNYWDGNNWQGEKIKIVGIETYKEIDSGHGNPAFSFWKKILLNNQKLTLSTSNCSGHLRPYWTEDLRDMEA